MIRIATVLRGILRSMMGPLSPGNEASSVATLGETPYWNLSARLAGPAAVCPYSGMFVQGYVRTPERSRCPVPGFGLRIWAADALTNACTNMFHRLRHRLNERVVSQIQDFVALSCRHPPNASRPCVLRAPSLRARNEAVRKPRSSPACVSPPSRPNPPPPTPQPVNPLRFLPTISPAFCGPHPETR